MNEPFLYDIVDTLSKEVSKYTPEALQERAQLMNTLYGFGGAYGLTRLGSWVVSKFLNERGLKVVAGVESVASKVLPFAPLVYMAIDPDGAKSIWQNHPVYSPGMIGTTLGVSLGLYNESRRIKRGLKELENIENIVNDKDK